MLYCHTVIEWSSVFFNGLWLVGSAVLLAGLSWHYWQAGEHKRPFRQQFQQPSFAQTGWIGLSLVTMGLAGTSSTTWETVLWVIGTAVCLLKTYQSLGGESSQQKNHK